jgi:hypothetical protein
LALVGERGSLQLGNGTFATEKYNPEGVALPMGRNLSGFP